MKGSIERLPSGRYRARWYTRDGRHPSKTFTTKRDAERFRQRAIVDSERSGMDIAERGATVQGLVDAWWATKERSVKPRTAERYELHKRYIEQRLGSVSLRELSYQRVQDFVDDAAGAYSPATVSGIYGVLALIIKDAVRRGRLPGEFPKPVLPRRLRPRLVIPTIDQVEQLAMASDARAFVAIILAGYCGLREGELLALHRVDVNLDEGWVFVHQARNKSSGALESTKTDESRRVYLPSRAAAVLAAHFEEYAGELVIPISASMLQKSWEVARKRCDLRRVRFHDLRHACASLCIHAGWSVTEVADYLGHSDPAVTLRTYSHLWPSSHADAIRKFDEYVAGHVVAS